MSKTLFIVLCLIAISFSAEKMSKEQLQIAKRDNDKLHVWVYFTDKGSIHQRAKKNIKIHPRTEERRLIRGTIKDSRWHDTHPLRDYMMAVETAGAVLRRQSRWLNAVSIEISEDQLGDILKLSFVSHVEPVHKFTKNPMSPEPKDKRDSFLGLKRFDESLTQSANIDYGFASEQIRQIHVNRAHDAGYHGEGVTILMLDTGFNLAHESLISTIMAPTHFLSWVVICLDTWLALPSKRIFYWQKLR
jgi:hypothetical protein